jgi:rare lipoprotein A
VPPAPATTPPAPPASAPPAAGAVPRAEPKSRYGNPPFYEVFGKRYYVLASSADYIERGVASWYGPGFHKVRTSTGETYDMYAMTAAHRTLPLPAYVSVTNLENGRSVVVRVNDRGPFVGNRIIDLSYAAAVKLDMLHDGTAMVEVRSISPGAAPPPALPVAAAVVATVTGSGTVAAAPAGAAAVGPMLPLPAPAAPATPPAPTGSPATSVSGSAPAASPAHGGLFVQAGAFADPANAERLAAKLRGGAFGRIVVRDDMIAGRRMFRVRIGPIADVPAFDRIVASLELAGVHDAHLALD